MKKYSYRKKLLLYYLSVFIVFLFITGTFQYFREKEYQVGKLETTLDNITEITRKYIEKHHIRTSNNYNLLDSLKAIIPQSDSRITVISEGGVVLYDSFIKRYSELENHARRPEVIEAKQLGNGTCIRRSASTGKEYYYYAKKIKEYYIRAAVVYDVTIVNFLKANRLFFYFIFGLFLLVLTMLWFVTKQFSWSISRLQDFAVNAVNKKSIDTNIQFPKDEIGVIGQQFMHIYDDLQNTQQDLVIEKERLFRHLFVINEGVAIFSSDKKKILSNQHFINYVNLISEKPLKGDEEIFKLKAFKKLNKFFDKYLQDDQKITKNQEVEKQITIQKDNKYFLIKCIIFFDKSFEIIITNITKKEKNKIIKHQMTSNIAHELKTPVSTIHAYLETILRNPDLDFDRKIHFIRKAFTQIERLSLLINDISTVNKLENTANFFKRETVNLYDIIVETMEDAQLRMDEKDISISCDFPEHLTIRGNRELFYSIFQNLVENSINYAGPGVTITISKYHEDKNYFYFSYADTGVGIPEKHLDRIFERFYRVDRGRSRKQGGTGLGLSIVKNAVQFHKGEISAKSRNQGGVEFLFTLKTRDASRLL